MLGDVTVTAAGTGYITAPQVTFVGGGGAANTAVAYATLTNNTIEYHLQPKDVVPAFERYFGRLSMQQGANLTPFYYVDPVTEFWQDSVTPGTPVAGDGTQIWMINPGLGVDSHPLHWHLFNLQVINRIGIDGVIRPPDPNELGWRETVRINPFEFLVVAARPFAPKTNFGLPDSIRPLSPTEPIGSTMSFTNLLPGGGITSITNQMTNFGYEYVWHCHILSHEENDMMRPVTFIVNTSMPAVPTGVAVSSSGVNNLSWTDATPATIANMGNAANEVGFHIQRATGASGGTFAVIATVPANTTSYIDGSATAGTTYRYIVDAFNNKGTSANSSTVTRTGSVALALPAAPAPTIPASGALVNIDSPMAFEWGAVIGNTSYTLQVLSGANVVVSMPGLISTTINLPNGLLKVGNYTWHVSTTNTRGTSAFSAAVPFVAASLPTQLAFTSAPQALTAGSASGTISLQTRGVAGTPTSVMSTATVNLTSSSAAGKFDTLATGPFDGSITSVQITVGNTSASFFYKDTAAGTPYHHCCGDRSHQRYSK